MQDHSSHRQIPLGAIAAASVLILATGSAAAWWGWNTIARTPAPVPEQTHKQPESSSAGQPVSPDVSTDHTQPAPKVATAPRERTLQVYWLKSAGNQVALVPATVKLSATTPSEATVKTALEQLLAGPADASVSTTIPEGTRLLNLAVKADGIHVDLSEEFTTGGGSTSMAGRVGQVLYTATSLNPQAPVWLSVAGQPLETLGGEGLLLEQPLTRKVFDRDFSL